MTTVAILAWDSTANLEVNLMVLASLLDARLTSHASMVASPRHSNKTATSSKDDCDCVSLTMARNTHFGENHQGLQVETNQGPIMRVKNRSEESKDKLLPGLFGWILRDGKYGSWRDWYEVCLLWIKGGPGKRKTMIQYPLALLRHFLNDATISRVR
jgi:hypothetical protein